MSGSIDIPTPVKITPSILGGDFGNLAAEAKKMADAGADALHIDIMDGHFVPNFALCARSVEAINRATNLFLDVHLMVYQPERWVEMFAKAGADRITIHFEATESLEDTLKYIRKCNLQAGIAFSPETSPTFVEKYLTSCDLILFMTVNPGFGGQPFMPEVLDKIRYTRELCNKHNIRAGGVIGSGNCANLPGLDIQVDGGINYQTAAECVKAGANVLAAGTYLYKSDNPAHSIKELRALRR